MLGVKARPPRVWTSAARWEAVAVFLVLLVGLLVRLPNLDRPLIEDTGFRQTETAYPALLFHQHGINLFAPQLPVFGRSSQVPFEFPLFQGMAAVMMNLGVAPDLALRITSLICFVATALALWGLVRHLSTRAAAVIAMVAFVASPYSVYWSRLSMIEYMATALAVGYAWAGMVWIDNRRKRYAVIAVVLGSLGMMVKLTTVVFWLVPLLLYWGTRRPRSDWRAWFVDRGRMVIVLMSIPLLAGALWTRHADSIKALNPATQWLTSGALKPFTLGSIHERLAIGNWRTVLQPISSHITGLPMWQLALIAVAAVWRERRAVWLGIVLAGVLPVVAFFNLYLVQNHYQVAITPVVAALVGYTLDAVISHLRSLPSRALAGAAIAVWLGATLYYDRQYLGIVYGGARDPDQVLARAAEVDAGTKPDDLIVFDGLYWSPAVPYYARRAGLMLSTATDAPQILDALPGQGYRYLFTVTPQPGVFSHTSLEALKRWAWFGAASTHLFRLGSAYSSLSSSVVAGSDVPFIPAHGDSSLLSAPTTIPCVGSVTAITVPAATTITLAFSDSGPIRGAGLQVDGQWIPAVHTVVVPAQRNDTGRLDLACGGGAALVLRQAFAISP